MKANTGKSMPTTANPPLESRRISEDDMVIDWKRTELLRAGFKLTWADEIALSEEADWRQAVNLLHQGCPQDLAAQICGAVVRI
jgi:hypothetical protein